MPNKPTVGVLIHANDPDTSFNPAVRDFLSDGSEVIVVDIVSLFHSVLLNRPRLHQLRDVLVAAADEYPLIAQPAPEPKAKPMVCEEVEF